MERIRRRSEPGSEHLHAEGHGVAAPETQGGEAGCLFAVLGGEQQGGEDARAGGADRVPEGDGAPVHRHPRPVPAKGPPVGDGLSAASASSEVSLRGPSSFSTTVGPFCPGISMGTISALKRHAAIAATAFWWLASANASWSARDTPAFLAVYSARLPMWVFEKESHNPSWIMPSTSWLLPALIPPRIPYTAKRSEEHTSELQSLAYLVCRLLLEK